MSEPELIVNPPPATTEVIRPALRNALIEDVAFGRANGQDRLTSFDTADDVGLYMSVLLSSPTDFKATETDGTILEVVHWMVGRRVLPDPETGEPREGPFLAFLLRDEKTWGTGSAGCIRSWAEIVRGKGPGPYSPPLKLMVKHMTLTGKRNYFILLPIQGVLA